MPDADIAYGGATDDLSRAESTKKEEAWEENTFSLCALPRSQPPPAARHRSRPLPASARGRAVSQGLHPLRRLSLN